MSSDKHKVEKREEVQATPRSCFLCFLSRTFLAFHEQICQLFTCCLSAPSCLSIFCKPHFPEMGRAGFLLAYRRHWRERRRPREKSRDFLSVFLAVIISVFPAVAVGFQLLSHHSPSEEPTVAGVDTALSSKVWALGPQSHFSEIHGSGSFPSVLCPSWWRELLSAATVSVLAQGSLFVLLASNIRGTISYMWSSLIFLFLFFSDT